MSEADTVLPAHESLVADWKQNAERNGEANFRFLRSLKMVREERVDAVAHELHRQVFGIIDCTRCAHCCKTMPPQLNDEDIERIAAALHMARAEFITAYLVLEEERGLKIKATPCPFLGRDDRCTIYDIRPENCRSFPNTDKEGQIWRTYQLSDNTQNCPAVYHIVEGMRHGRGFSGSHPVLDTPLHLDAIVGELDAPAQVLPREAIAAARRHRQHIIPLLIDLIDQATRAAALEDEVRFNGHFFALFLLTEFRATEALPAIVAAVSLPGDEPFALFDDAITETLPRVFAVLAHEHVADVLLPLIRNRQVNEYVRRAAADSLAFMVSAGLRQRDDVMPILKELLREAVEHKDTELVNGLICTLCDLYPEEAMEEIRTAYAGDLVDEFMIALDDMERELRRGRDETLKRLLKRSVFIDDTVKELENWASFQPDDEDDDEEIELPFKSRPKPLPTVLPASRPEPARRPEGRVGRNDPCPCGSGKKFKRCCALKS